MSMSYPISGLPAKTKEPWDLGASFDSNFTFDAIALTPRSFDPLHLNGTAGTSGPTETGPTGGIVPASETVTLAGSLLVFVNTYLSGVTDAYRTAVLFAEHELQSHFSNNVTITVSFGFANLNGFLAQNSFH